MSVIVSEYYDKVTVNGGAVNGKKAWKYRQY